jgi:hypothetical protein
MATNTITAADVDALAVRLLAHVKCLEGLELPAVQADCLLAGRVLRALLRDDVMPEPIELGG